VTIAPSQPVDPLSSPYLDPEYVAQVVSNPDIVERNRQITRGYHELACAVGEILGRESANWLCFGVFASAEAGRAIRRESVPGFARPIVGRLVSEAVARGNAAVFGDVALPFARFVVSFADARIGSAVPSEARVRTILGELCAHAQLCDNADLTLAFVAYADALLLRDVPGEEAATRRAQRMLVGNAATGAHEQMVVDPYVRQAIPGRAILPLLGTAAMGLRMPQGMLELDKDVPAAVYLNGAVFPTALITLVDADALALAARFGQDPESTRYSNAPNWESYLERMGYIFTLLRVFQQDPHIFDMAVLAPEDDVLRAPVRSAEW
jgi:hypothetical protein